MLKKITLGDREISFKSSAATNILFKRAFKEDITVLLQSYTKNFKELQKMQKNIADLRADTTKSQAEILEAMGDMMQSEVYLKAASFQNDTLPQLAYIMYLEANESIDIIFTKLNEVNYLTWLLTINQEELTQVTTEVLRIWRAGAQTTSNPKNANG